MKTTKHQAEEVERWIGGLAWFNPSATVALTLAWDLSKANGAQWIITEIKGTNWSSCSLLQHIQMRIKSWLWTLSLCSKWTKPGRSTLRSFAKSLFEEQGVRLVVMPSKMLKNATCPLVRALGTTKSAICMHQGFNCTYDTTDYYGRNLVFWYLWVSPTDFRKTYAWIARERIIAHINHWCRYQYVRKVTQAKWKDCSMSPSWQKIPGFHHGALCVWKTCSSTEPWLLPITHIKPSERL